MFIIKTKYFVSIFITLLWVIFFSFSRYTIASNTTDSLRNIIKTSNNDSLIIETSIRLGFSFENVNFDSSVFYYNSAVELARSINNNSLQAKTLVNYGFAYYYGKKSLEAIKYLEEGLKIYRQEQDTLSILNTYYNLGFVYGGFEEYSKAIQYYLNAIKIATSIDNAKMQAKLYNNIG